MIYHPEVDMTGERQGEFRAEYRRKIEPWYNGFVHVAVVYALGGSLLWWVLSQLERPITVVQWLVVPAVALTANLLEWAVHRYVMHRPGRNLVARAIYRRHTLMHHQFFTSEDPTLEGVRDFRIVFFPPYTELGVLALAAPGALLIASVLGANAGWLTLATVGVLYLVYETFHFCCHVPENWFVRHAPLVNTIRRHHIAHHDQGIMMHLNMNLTFPIADYLFGTSDIRRSLIGTLFNGYSTQHLRRDLQRARDTSLAPPEAAAP
jgi:hypothetical protein